MQKITANPPTRDPAPSRLSYRMQRWMLTPGIRFGLRAGVPFCLTLAVASAYLADQGRPMASTSLSAVSAQTFRNAPNSWSR